MIKIDKNVPMPEKNRPGRKPKYPFREMQVGDSFFVPRPEARSTKQHRALLYKAAGKYRLRKPGFSVVIRPVTENGVEGVRVWRAK